MKRVLFLLILGLILLPLPAQAISFKVLVLPTDLMNVCNNYYCYDEASTIIANEVVENFSLSHAVLSPNLSAVRTKMNANPTILAQTTTLLRKYNYNKSLDMNAIKNVSDAFDAKSVLIISSSVTTKNSNLKRGFWEILDLSSAFGIVYPYELETNAVLIDTVNGLVMWSGNYKKKLGNNNNEFKAKTPSEASMKLEQLEMYSKAIVARSIAQNVTLRFFPKTPNPVINKNIIKDASPSAMFRMENTTPTLAPKEFDKSEIQGVNEGDFGEIIYGL